MATVTRKNTATVTPVPVKATPAKKATPVKGQTLTPAKATPATPVPATPAACQCDPKIAVLRDMIAKQNATLETLQTHCELLERLFVSIQTATLTPATPATPATPVPAKVETATPAKATPVPAKKATPAKAKKAATVSTVDPSTYSTLVDTFLAECVKGIEKDAWFEKVCFMCDYDLRPFADSSARAVVKSFKDANKGFSMVVFALDVIAKFERDYNGKASDYNPLTLPEHKAAREAAGV